MMESLSQQPWFLGELSSDAAIPILGSSGLQNVFIVFKDPKKQMIVIAISHTQGTSDAIEILDINCTNGKYTVSGQTGLCCDDVIGAVRAFASTYSPPLLPAFDNTFDPTLSIGPPPPAYSQSERALQPAVAPLPRISKKNTPVRVTPPANTGQGTNGSRPVNAPTNTGQGTNGSRPVNAPANTGQGTNGSRPVNAFADFQPYNYHFDPGYVEPVTRVTRNAPPPPPPLPPRRTCNLL